MGITFVNGDQKFLTATDLNSIVDAINGNGVVVGLTTTQNSPAGMSVVVSSGTCVVNGTSVSKSSSTTVSIASSNPTNPRYDVIQINSSGTISAVTGTPSSSPLVPDISAGNIRLAIVYVPAGATSITNANITDARVILGNVGYNPGASISITYNADGTINTITDNMYGITATFTYDASKNISTITESYAGTTRTYTFTYTSGQITSITVS